MIRCYRIRRTWKAVKLEADNQAEVEDFLRDRRCIIEGGSIPNMIEPAKWAIAWKNKGDPGTRTAYEGDYIVLYYDGCVPVPAEIFEKRYEAVGRGIVRLEQEAPDGQF